MNVRLRTTLAVAPRLSAIARRRVLSCLLSAVGTSLVAACSFAPSYKVPETTATASYKEANSSGAEASQPVDVGNWSGAEPADTTARGPWWTRFNDPTLNQLEDQAHAANQNLAAAAARYREARAAADIAGTDLFPILSAGASGTRERVSKYAPTNTTGAPHTGGDFILRAQTSYELDFWGRVRNGIAAERSRAQASAADLATAQLSIESELAGDYFELRGLDAQVDLLSRTVESYREALRITTNRYQGGVSAAVDVDQATTQLETAQVQLADTQLSRAQLEHAIAILIGSPPSNFTLAPANLDVTPPGITPGLPSQLLQRRPDVASAERSVFAANAEIGVTRAAWFPTFTLDGDFGFESVHTGNWIEAPARMWSIGPSAVLTIFDAGLRRAQNQQSVAAFDESVANYRQTVLSAYAQVEDQLAAIRWLDQQLASQDRAVASSQRALDQSNYRYKGGIVTFLEVVTAQNAALQAQQAALNLRVRRLNASLQLIKALGGDWTPAQLDHPIEVASQPAAATSTAQVPASASVPAPTSTTPPSADDVAATAAAPTAP